MHFGPVQLETHVTIHYTTLQYITSHYNFITKHQKREGEAKFDRAEMHLELRSPMFGEQYVYMCMCGFPWN